MEKTFKMSFEEFFFLLTFTLRGVSNKPCLLSILVVVRITASLEMNPVVYHGCEASTKTNVSVINNILM